MRVSIFGCGYVGLVTAACLAEFGNSVLCCDSDEEKIKALDSGFIPFYEPGLHELLSKAHEDAGNLAFTSDGAAAVEFGDVLFICVGTPNKNGKADTTAVLDVARAIGQHTNNYKTVVIKSTVPPGTAESVAEKIRASYPELIGLRADVVSCPEFLREGNAINDFLKPDRVIIGSNEGRAIEILRELYAPFASNEKIIIMDNRSAELTKYAANAFLATKISFINEMAVFAEAVGADIELIRQGIGTDPRIGRDYLRAGIGYGGSCLPKDTRALLNAADNAAMALPVVWAAQQNNSHILSHFMGKFFARAKGNMRVAVWGLSFKPDTSDIRESPARRIVDDLLDNLITVFAHDPAATGELEKFYGNDFPDTLHLCQDKYDTLDGVDALLVLTEWNEYKAPDFQLMAELMRGRDIFDGRNIYNPAVIKKAGFNYIGIGRK